MVEGSLRDDLVPIPRIRHPRTPRQRVWEECYVMDVSVSSWQGLFAVAEGVVWGVKRQARFSWAACVHGDLSLLLMRASSVPVWQFPCG